MKPIIFPALTNRILDLFFFFNIIPLPPSFLIYILTFYIYKLFEQIVFEVTNNMLMCLLLTATSINT